MRSLKYKRLEQPTHRFAVMCPANGLGQYAAHVNNLDLVALALVVTLRHRIRNRHALNL